MKPQIIKIMHGLQASEVDTNFYIAIKDTLSILLKEKNLQAHWHPLGFIILNIQDWKHGKRLRLHIWPKGMRKFNQNRNWIHSHEYNITSLVLMGAIINNKYDCFEDILLDGVPVYNVKHEQNNSNLLKVEKSYNVNFIEKERITSGQIYQIPIGTFHSSDTALDDETCTIVLNKEKQLASPEILGFPENDQTEFLYKRELCDQALIVRLIEKVIANITSIFIS